MLLVGKNLHLLNLHFNLINKFNIYNIPFKFRIDETLLLENYTYNICILILVPPLLSFKLEN